MMESECGWNFGEGEIFTLATGLKIEFWVLSNRGSSFEPTQSPVHYDPQYALRLCAEQSLDEACVYIYAAMGLFEESVDLALKVSCAGVATISS